MCAVRMLRSGSMGEVEEIRSTDALLGCVMRAILKAMLVNIYLLRQKPTRLLFSFATIPLHALLRWY